MSGATPSRRQAFKFLAGLGVGTATFQRALAAQAEQPGPVTAEMIKQAEWVAGIKLSEDERKGLASSLTAIKRDLRTLRELKLDQGAAPAVSFQPAPWLPPASPVRGLCEISDGPEPKRPAQAEDLAFL